MLIVEHCIRKGLGQRKNLEGAHHNYYTAKQIRTKYTNTLKNKKKCFELTMSNKLAQLRRCDSKKFWNLLYSEGIDNTCEHEIFNSSCEELDREFTRQEIREAILHHIKYHKVPGSDGISNGDLNGYKTWFYYCLTNFVKMKSIFLSGMSEFFLYFRAGALMTQITTVA